MKTETVQLKANEHFGSAKETLAVQIYLALGRAGIAPDEAGDFLHDLSEFMDEITCDMPANPTELAERLKFLFPPDPNYPPKTFLGEGI